MNDDGRSTNVDLGVDVQIAMGLLRDRLAFSTAVAPEGLRLWYVAFRLDAPEPSGIQVYLCARQPFFVAQCALLVKADRPELFGRALEHVVSTPFVRLFRDNGTNAELGTVWWVRAEFPIELQITPSILPETVRAACQSVIAGASSLVAEFSDTFTPLEVVKRVPMIGPEPPALPHDGQDEKSDESAKPVH